MNDAPNKPRTQWSHSRLQTFEQCPRRYYHQYVAKDVQDTQVHPNTVWGSQVHEAIERRIKTGEPLPANMQQYSPAVELVANLPGVEAEVRYAITMDWRRTDFFSPDVWGRAIIDVLYFTPDGTTAAVWDWKLGKYRGDTDQARVNALMLFTTNPGLQTVHTQFTYLKEGKVDKQHFTRDQLPVYAEPTLETLRKINLCLDNDAWHPTPSGLCAWCPVTRCQFNRSRRA